MANKSASAKKRVRQNIKRRLRNKSVLSNLKSRIKVFKAAVGPDRSLQNVLEINESPADFILLSLPITTVIG